MNPKIKRLWSKQIFDSRGNPTIETDVFSDCFFARSMVPSGASTGKHEALELRDGGKRFGGKGVLKAINNVNKKIAPKLRGKDCRNQKEIDELMIKLDGTENKSKLGANSILSVSMAVCKASTMHKSVTLYKRISELSKSKIRIPVPCFNIINGGVHAGNKLEVQEFMIMPVGAKTFKQAMQIGSEVYWELKKIISKKYGKNSVNVGDEGGFAPPLKNSREALDLIMSALKKTGYLKKTSIGMDCAASEFYKKGKYKIDGKSLTREKLLDYYVQLVKKYPIISIEDPFAEDDFKGFSLITKKLGKKIQIVGDDLLVTNIKRIEKAVKEKACNSLLLKVNQIGTLTEALDAAKLAKKNKWSVMVSHRSGETEDSFIADLAVGIGAGQIKSGAPCRSERLAKYNQLLRIEEELGKRAKYAGKNFRKNA